MLIDSKIKHSSVDLEVILRITSIVLACVNYKAAKHPKMHDVISMLLKNMPINNSSICFEYKNAIGDDISSFGGTFDTFEKEKIDSN